jgi:hypothetical protein
MVCESCGNIVHPEYIDGEWYYTCTVCLTEDALPFMADPDTDGFPIEEEF